jgi:hypothetical protein
VRPQNIVHKRAIFSLRPELSGGYEGAERCHLHVPEGERKFVLGLVIEVRASG